jgi:plastocyanin
MRLRRPPLLGSLLAVLMACGGGGTTGNGTTQYPQQPPAGNPVSSATVAIIDDAFSPASVLLAAGGSVTWNWVGSGHSVTSDGQPSFTPNAPISNAPRTLGPVVFSTAGSYRYYCTAHGGAGGYGGDMVGTIFVQ